MAGRFQNVVVALARRTFVFEHVQGLHGLRPAPFQNVVLAVALRTFVYTIFKSFTKHCALVGFRTMREWRSGTIQDRQDATVKLIRG
eukprot:3801463-Pyramimonas_sp.AAC.1